MDKKDIIKLKSITISGFKSFDSEKHSMELLQSPENLPSIIVIDEPEPGLHPSAIIELASMVKIASQHVQIILATQSPVLLDEFLPEQITVIERDPISKSSTFKNFTEEDLKYWLEEYTLSELLSYEKNASISMIG